MEKAKEQWQEMFSQAKLEAETQGMEDELMFTHVMSCMIDCGFGSLHGYLHCLTTMKAQHASSPALKLLIKECTGLLNNMRNKQPGVVNQWAAAATGKIMADEGLRNLLV